MRGKIIIPFIVLALITGCSDKFSCKETMGGIRCKNVQAVYDERVLNAGQTTEEKVLRKKPENREVAAKATVPVEQIVRGLDNDESRPIRIPSVILRIWTAPWEDQDGDLHKPGYIYCEISGKRGRWLFGEQNVEASVGYVAPHRTMNKTVSAPDTDDKEKQTTKKPKAGSAIFGGRKKGTVAPAPIPGLTGTDATLKLSK